MEEIFDRYILAEPEAIMSKLAVEPVLRTHVLALIADNFIRDMEEAKDFFRKTFWAHQYKRHDDLFRKVEDVIDLLADWGFIKVVSGRLVATRVGRRVSELYLDPASAYYLITHLSRAAEARTESLSFLHLICRTGEMRPLLRIRQSDFMKFETELAKHSHLLIEPEPSAFDLEYEDYLDALKTALMFQGWIDEMPEGKRENKLGIFEVYRVAPGSLRQKLLNADWMLYATGELCRLLKIPKVKELNGLRMRVRYGIREELVDLVRLRGIGRVRARMLYKRGIRSAADVKKATVRRLGSIIGPKVAENVKAQLR
jgi:helicase